MPLSGLIHNKNTSDSDVSAREKCPLNTGRFYTKRGLKFRPKTGTFFFQNNQQANGVEGEQQSENMQEVTKNSN